jgi:hypothetical protein
MIDGGVSSVMARSLGAGHDLDADDMPISPRFAGKFALAPKLEHRTKFA